MLTLVYWARIIWRSMSLIRIVAPFVPYHRAYWREAKCGGLICGGKHLYAQHAADISKVALIALCFAQRPAAPEV